VKALSGTVMDPNRGLLPGARVIVVNAEAKEMGQTYTNDAGRFEFASLAAGNYSITVQLTGFKSLQIKNVKVEKDKLIDLNMILELSGDVETIGIVATMDLFDTTPGTTIISGDLIRRLPIQ